MTNDSKKKNTDLDSKKFVQKVPGRQDARVSCPFKFGNDFQLLLFFIKF